MADPMENPVTARPLISAISDRNPRAERSFLRRHAAALLVASALAPAAMTILPDSHGRFGIVAAQAQQNVAIDKIDFAFPAFTLTLSGITASNSSLNRAEIEGLFKADDPKAALALLRRFHADSLAAKTLEFTFKHEGSAQTTVYSDVAFKGIRAGAADLLSLREMRQGGSEKVGSKAEIAYTATAGRMSVEKFDLAGMLSWALEADPTGKAPVKPLHGRYEVEYMQMNFGDTADLRLGKMHFSGFSARLPRKPLIEMIDLAKRMDDPKAEEKAKNEAGLQMLSRVIDLYSSLQIGDGAIDGITFKGKGEDKGQEVKGSIGKIIFNGGKAPKGVVSDIDVATPEGFFKLKSASIEGDFYGTMLVMIQQVLASLPNSTNPAAETELRALVQEAVQNASTSDIGYRIEGLDADLPPPKNGKSKERIALKLGSYHTFAGKFVGYMPTKIDFGLKNFRMNVPADSRDEGIRTLRELGISTLDMSAGLKVNWDETTSRLAISELGGEIDKFAKLAITGEIANIPRAVFENPQTNWPIALMGGSAQKLSVSLDNLGGLQKLLEKTAKDQKKTPEQLRVELATMAPAIIGAFMSTHPDAQALSEAIGGFAKGLGAFSIAVRGATPGGITAADVMAAGQNPAALLQKVRFEARGK
jgi:hypothetical protein